MRRKGQAAPIKTELSALAGFQSPPEVILLAVRWYLRYGLSDRDLEELLAERGIEVDHVTLHRRVQRFTTSLTAHWRPVEVITDRAPALAHVIDELIPAAFHNTGQYENNRCKCDHARLKTRRRPMRGLKADRSGSVAIRGHAFVQNLRRGHYELGTDTAPAGRLAAAFDELALAI